jgi:AmiR/NasT family two-component response regulator
MARLQEQVSGLTVALGTRTTIALAVGMLMAQAKVTPDQAFDVLRRASQRENRKLREIAADLVTNHIAKVTPG